MTEKIITEQGIFLQKKSTRLTEFSTACVKMEQYYYMDRNLKMLEVMEQRQERVRNAIYKLSIELQPYRAIARKEHEKSDLHKFLMDSKGMNGRDILILNGLSRMEMQKLTKPN